MSLRNKKKCSTFADLNGICNFIKSKRKTRRFFQNTGVKTDMINNCRYFIPLYVNLKKKIVYQYDESRLY
jgi:hypothetical protein